MATTAKGYLITYGAEYSAMAVWTGRGWRCDFSGGKLYKTLAGAQRTVAANAHLWPRGTTHIREVR